VRVKQEATLHRFEAAELDVDREKRRRGMKCIGSRVSLTRPDIGRLVCALLLLFFFQSPGFAAPIRIMPLGASLTVGSSSGVVPDERPYWVSYRKPLLGKLTSAGYDIDFVGSELSGEAVFDDPQHEGHAGWTAFDPARPGSPSILKNVYGFLKANPADIVLLHVGTNDVSEGHADASEIDAILDEIDRHGEKVWVILALIVNRVNPPCTKCMETTRFNDAVYDMALGRKENGDKIVIVDMENDAGIIYRRYPDGDMYDTLHLVESGYLKMADLWFKGLMEILPKADAGPDQKVRPGSAVALDGRSSSIPVGAIASYHWSQTAGSPPVALSNAASAVAGFTAPEIGPGEASLVFRLTVTDDKGFQHQDTCEVEVIVSPVADAGPDQVVVERSTVRLDGSGSYDKDGRIESYLWHQTGGSPVVMLSNADSAIASFTAPGGSPGGLPLVFQLTVTNDRGDQGTDVCSIEVNAPPSADAGPNQIVNPGTRVTLDGSRSEDSDGRIVSYAWIQTEGALRVDIQNADSAVATFTAPAAGPGGASLVFQLTVADENGARHTDACTVRLNAPPSSDAGPNQIVNPGTRVTLDGSRSEDSDGRIVSYAWIQTEGALRVDIQNADSAVATFTAPAVRETDILLVFELIVTDDQGGEHRDTCDVKLSAGLNANPPPPPHSSGPAPGSSSGGGCFVSSAGLDANRLPGGLKRLAGGLRTRLAQVLPNFE
jgi:hypothetical protein